MNKKLCHTTDSVIVLTLCGVSTGQLVMIISNFVVMQALQYLHKLCSHPALVITPHHPQYESIMASLQRTSTSLRDIQHAPKLVALQYVLIFI